SAWVKVSEYGLTNILREQPQPIHKPVKTEIRFPWAPVSAILATSLIVILVISLTKVVPEANASELLGHAMQNESRLGATGAFQIRVQGTTCGVGRGDGQLVPVEKSTLCSEATNLVQKTPWRSRALSARTFHDWHDSLSERHDTVTKDSSSWMIDTTTPV